MISQIPGGATALEQLVCIASGFREAVGMTLKGLAIETEDGLLRFVAQFTVYARALGVALAQKTYDTHGSSERAAHKELLSKMDLDGKLWRMPCTPPARFSVVPGAGGRPARERQIQPEDPPPSDRLSVPGKTGTSLSRQRITRSAMGATPSGSCGPWRQRSTSRPTGPAAHGSWR